MVWSFLNFFIFLFLLWKAAKKPAAEAVQHKSEVYRKLFLESSEAFARAEKRLQTLKGRFVDLEKELQRIKLQARQSAELEAEKLKEEAQKVSLYLSEEAQRVSEVELAKAKGLLKGELWEQTKQGVVRQLQAELTPEKQKQVLEESIGSLGALKK